MSSYEPGQAFGARIHKEAEKWTLVLVRDLKHAPAKVWTAITDPEHLKAWAPFDSDKSLAAPGTVKLTTIGAPPEYATAEAKVKRAEAPKLLEYSWGEQDLRWELEPQGTGTRLTLWHNIAKPYIAMGAAGWHICFDVLDRLIAGEPIGRMVGPQSMQFKGWQRLHREYAQQFGVKTPDSSTPTEGQ